MTEDDAYESATVPTFPAVCAPPHVLYVPVPLLLMNVGLLFAVAVLAGMVVGGGLRLEFGLLPFVAVHGYLAWRYRRDPHIWGVWKARLSARPTPSAFGHVHRLPLPGRMRFSP